MFSRLQYDTPPGQSVFGSIPAARLILTHLAAEPVVELVDVMIATRFECSVPVVVVVVRQREWKANELIASSEPRMRHRSRSQGASRAMQDWNATNSPSYMSHSPLQIAYSKSWARHCSLVPPCVTILHPSPQIDHDQYGTVRCQSCLATVVCITALRATKSEDCCVSRRELNNNVARIMMARARSIEAWMIHSVQGRTGARSSAPQPAGPVLLHRTSTVIP